MIATTNSQYIFALLNSCSLCQILVRSRTFWNFHQCLRFLGFSAEPLPGYPLHGVLVFLPRKFLNFWISCQDFGIYSWQGSQDFARFSKTLARNLRNRRSWKETKKSRSWQEMKKNPRSWQKNKAPSTGNLLKKSETLHVLLANKIQIFRDQISKKFWQRKHTRYYMYEHYNWSYNLFLWLIDILCTSKKTFERNKPKQRLSSFYKTNKTKRAECHASMMEI